MNKSALANFYAHYPHKKTQPEEIQNEQSEMHEP